MQRICLSFTVKIMKLINKHGLPKVELHSYMLGAGDQRENELVC